MTGRDRLVTSIAILIFLAGCIEGSNSGDTSDPPPTMDQAQSQIDLGDTPEPLNSSADWESYQVNATGPAESWMAVFREFPNLTEPHYQVEMTVEASGDGSDPLGLFVTPPSMLRGNETPITETTRTWATGHGDLYIDPQGQSLSKQYSFEMDRTFLSEANSTAIRGLYAVVGSTGEWTATITVTNLLTDTKNSTGPSFTSAGDGASLAYPGEVMLGSDDTPIGNIALEKTLTKGGWTHIEYFSDPMFYGTHHEYYHDCRWVIGNSSRDCSDRYGGDDDRITAWGRYPSEPGVAWINITYIETTEGLELAIMHLPGDQILPGDPQGIGYALFRDFFGDERVDSSAFNNRQLDLEGLSQEKASKS